MNTLATQPLGIVVIGLGGFGNFIAGCIRQSETLQLLGGYDPDEDAARSWSDRWQAAQSLRRVPAKVTSWRDLPLHTTRTLHAQRSADDPQLGCSHRYGNDLSSLLVPPL